MKCLCAGKAEGLSRRIVGAGFSPFPVPPPRCGESELVLQPGKLYRIDITADGLRSAEKGSADLLLKVYGGGGCNLLADSSAGGVFTAPHTGGAQTRMRIEIGGDIELGPDSWGNYDGNYRIVVESH